MNKKQITMCKHFFIIGLFVIFTVAASGQTKNRRDAEGRKQGYWEAVDSKGGLVYTGNFKDDKPVGEMIRYFPTGERRVIMNYDNSSVNARARFFWQDGGLAAKGNYVDTKRDSVWLYYSQSGNLSSRVEYVAGKRNGKEQKYYPDGITIAEETFWKDDLKDGAWKQYFNNSQLKFTATCINGKLEGAFASYYPDGNTELEGVYRNGAPDGDWKRHDENGEYVLIKYDKGTITNLDELDEAEQIFFRKTMEQERNIPEPAIEDMFR